MKHPLIAILGAAALCTVAFTATAHHSAIQFDFTTQASYTGVVTYFRAINPHMQIKLQVKDDKGEREIQFEGHSTNNMYRSGYRKGMINVGDTITVNVAPLKDGSDGGYVVSAQTPKGFFGMQSRRLDAARLQQEAEGTRPVE